MVSGYLYWANGSLYSRGTDGNFWASTPSSYTSSRYLDFNSTYVYPKNGGGKPLGFPLRCVARFICIFPSRALRSLPLSVMMSGDLYWIYGSLGGRGTNGHFWASTPYSYTSSRDLYFSSTNVYPKSGNDKPYGLPLRRVARNPQKPHLYFTSINFRNFPPRSKFLFPALSFQSSPQPSSFGYVVGRSRLGQWSRQ